MYKLQYNDSKLVLQYESTKYSDAQQCYSKQLYR